MEKVKQRIIETIIQINRYFYQPVLGVIILLAVLIDSIRSKRSHG